MGSHTGLKYFTIEDLAGPEEIKIKGSRFIAYLYPVSDISEVNEILADLRKRYHDASHICTAFRFHGHEEDVFRYDDDGEPGGTAGLPIYYGIKGRQYFNILVVVIRYFGGIKLGTGGLAKAYATAARKVLESSKKVLRYVRTKAVVLFPYDFTGEMRQLIHQYSLEVIDQDYRSDGIFMEIFIPVIRMEKIKQILRDKSKGSIELK
ncbi:MAG: YigZ family protein, partial [Candidatus Aminicenantes bacterium]|nr:YigZ family protein [Candidatus Aminicenantes bacterium]